MKTALASKRSFSIPQAVSAQLDEMVPEKKRSAFVAEALAAALHERQRMALLDLIDITKPQAGPDGVSSAVEIIRASREGRVHQLSSLIAPHEG